MNFFHIAFNGVLMKKKKDVLSFQEPLSVSIV